MNAKDVEQLESLLGVPFVDSYGMTETGGGCFSTLPGIVAPRGFAGVPISPGLEIKICDNEGNEALFGQLAGQRSRGKGSIQTLGKLYHQDLLALQGGIPNGLPWLECALDPLAWLAFVMGTAAPTSPAAAPASTPVPAVVVSSTPLPSSSPHILPRTSPRSQQRIGIALTEELLPGVPNARHYTTPVGPYRGRPRGRPNRGLTKIYQPTGRPRGRPRGSGRRGRSVRSHGLTRPI